MKCFVSMHVVLLHDLSELQLGNVFIFLTSVSPDVISCSAMKFLLMQDILIYQFSLLVQSLNLKTVQMPPAMDSDFSVISH